MVNNRIEQLIAKYDGNPQFDELTEKSKILTALSWNDRPSNAFLLFLQRIRHNEVLHDFVFKNGIDYRIIGKDDPITGGKYLNDEATCDFQSFWKQLKTIGIERNHQDLVAETGIHELNNNLIAEAQSLMVRLLLEMNVTSIHWSDSWNMLRMMTGDRLGTHEEFEAANRSEVLFELLVPGEIIQLSDGLYQLSEELHAVLRI